MRLPPFLAAADVSAGALKAAGAAVDGMGVWERCRFCGSTAGRELVLVEGELACPACAGSPLCDGCGHRRGDHTGVFQGGGRSCAHVRVDFQTGVRLACGCDGFTPLVGGLRDAAFLDRDPDDGLPPLRIAEPQPARRY